MSVMVALADTWGSLKQLGLVYTEQWDHVYVKKRDNAYLLLVERKASQAIILVQSL